MASGEMTDEAFGVFLSEALGACARVSRDGAVHFVCMDWRHMDDVAAVGKQVTATSSISASGTSRTLGWARSTVRSTN